MQHRKWQLAFSSIYFWCSSQKAHKHFKYCFSLLWSSINTKTASSQFCLCKALLIARNNVMIKVYSCMITSFFILLLFFFCCYICVVVHRQVIKKPREWQIRSMPAEVSSAQWAPRFESVLVANTHTQKNTKKAAVNAIIPPFWK